jgi:multidrug efflux pump subunit AcrA (membrane-fusion protein)
MPSVLNKNMRRSTRFHSTGLAPVVGLIAILGLAGATLGCNRATTPTGGGRGGAGGRQDRVAIKTVKIQRIAVQRQVEISGTLLSPNQAKVSSEVAGVVREVPMQIGTVVRAGDPLVILDKRELTLAFERAESSLRQVEAQLEIDGNVAKAPPADDQIASVRQAAATRDDAAANLARVERLIARGILSQADLDSARTKSKVADATYQSTLASARSLKASLQDRRASYDLARKKLEDAVIKAPVDGAVSERLVQPGEFIQANVVVATIVSINPLKLRTALQEKYAGLIAPKLAVEFRVTSFPDQVFKGEMAYVSPAVDQATRTFVVEALINNDDRRLKPGFFAKGVVTTKLDSNVPAVTENAVSTLAGVSAVYIVEDGKVRQQAVVLGVKQGDLYEIVDGLKGDEELAATNLNQLATGTAIQTGQGGAAAPEGAAPAAGQGGAGRGDATGTGGRRGKRGQGAGQRGGQR